MEINEFQNLLRKKKIDIAIFYNQDQNPSSNMVYFSRYKGVGALIIPKNKKPLLIAPKMEHERAKKGIIKRVYIWDKNIKLFGFVKDKINKNKIKNKIIGIDKNYVTLNVHKSFKKQFKKSKFVDISDDCLKLRETKTNEEIKLIRKSCNIMDNIFKNCFKSFKKFKTETGVAAFLENEAKKAGCEIAFKPIVASGKSSSMPHYEPKNIKLKKGFCIIDFGVNYNGYNSDMTRTIYIGKPSKKEIEIYNFLLDAQKNIIKKIKVNKKCSGLYNEVKKDLKQYKKYFTHGLGHGLGVDVHEMPNLTENSKDKIKNNMIFTIEPGIYFPNEFGIRIEDDILMNKKVEVLTKTTKDLLIF